MKNTRNTQWRHRRSRPVSSPARCSPEGRHERCGRNGARDRRAATASLSPTPPTLSLLWRSGESSVRFEIRALHADPDLRWETWGIGPPGGAGRTDFFSSSSIERRRRRFQLRHPFHRPRRRPRTGSHCAPKSYFAARLSSSGLPLARAARVLREAAGANKTISPILFPISRLPRNRVVDLAAQLDGRHGRAFSTAGRDPAAHLPAWAPPSTSFAERNAGRLSIGSMLLR